MRVALAVVALVLAGCASTPLPPWPAAASTLAPPHAALDWDDFMLQAAHRMVDADPGAAYTGPVPAILLAIPVLEVELDRDGSVRHIEVVREPTQAQDTVELAIQAVRRGAPYGDMTRLPRPWKFTEVFLFDDARRFKPRTLDE
ncbi:MAG: hypothetical protein KGL43_05810 [Burkholderiales bacterium]|nr:hypothetical protein [Burkholderiales bacterium]MDE2453089.1 hypothetical protein [Burkholderiales bacterium]